MTTYTRPVQNQSTGATYVEQKDSTGASPIGAVTDTAETDSTQDNTVIGALKGLLEIFGDVWDAVSHGIQVINIAKLSSADDSVSIRPDDYTTDNSNMPTNPKVLPVGKKYNKTAPTYDDTDAAVGQSDRWGNDRRLTPHVTALARTVSSSISSSTTLTLQSATTILRVYAIDKDVYIKWGATAVDATNFDEVIPANQIVDLYVPGSVTELRMIERSATATVIIIEK